MNNLYEQNYLEIQHQADDQILKLNDRKFYTKNDLNDLNRLWFYRCCGVFGGTVILTCIVIHFLY